MEQKSSSGPKGTLRSSRLVRDIKDSLGKLPPAAEDLEQSILGTLLTFNTHYHLLTLIRPDYFYTEQHREIYGAIRSLHAQKAPINLKSTVHELRATGKLEIVGGVYYLSELNARSVSAASAEHDARIVIEMYIKRSLIQIGSQLHQLAYEDTSDALEILQQAQDSIRFLHESTVKTPTADLIKITWGEVLIDKEPPAEQPLITINGVQVCSVANHSMVMGKKKSRKSLFIVWAVGEFLKFNNEAAIFDTEQGKRHVWKYQDRVHRYSKKKIPVFFLRGKSHIERRQIIEDTLEHWPTKFKLIVIDGIRDLISNINDPDQCMELVVWLEHMILKHNVHIINVLHENKTDGQARGHIGSELLNKAETIIQLENNDETGSTTVKCEAAREKPFEPFSFTHSHDDLPMLTDAPINNEVINVDEKLFRLKIIFEAGSLSYKEYIDGIKEQFGVGTSKAGKLLGDFRRYGWVLTNGKPKSKETMYKLIVDVPDRPAPMSVNGNGQHKEEVKKVVIPSTNDLPF